MATGFLVLACSKAFTSGAVDAGPNGNDASMHGGGGVVDTGGTGSSGHSGASAMSGGTAGASISAGGRGSGGRSGSSGSMALVDSGTRSDADNTTGGGAGGSGGATLVDAGGPPPIPTDGLVLWLRADRGVTASNNLVSTWADQSGSGYDATQRGTRLQPVWKGKGINGHPAIAFDGVDDYLQIAKPFDIAKSEVTVFALAEASNPDACTGIFESSNGTEDNDINLGSYKSKLNFEVYTTANEDITFDADVPVVFGGTVYADGNGEILHNGVSEVRLDGFQVPADVSRLQTFIGKSLYSGCSAYSGLVGEVIVYDRALTHDEMLQVSAYVGGKYECCQQQ